MYLVLRNKLELDLYFYIVFHSSSVQSTKDLNCDYDSLAIRSRSGCRVLPRQIREREFRSEMRLDEMIWRRTESFPKRKY